METFNFTCYNIILVLKKLKSKEREREEGARGEKGERERERETYPESCTEHKDDRDQKSDDADYLDYRPYYVGSINELLCLIDGPNQEECTVSHYEHR